MNLDRVIELTNHYERMSNVLYFMIFVQFLALMLLMWYNSRLAVDRKNYWSKLQTLEIENARLRVESATRKEVIDEMLDDFKKGAIRDS